MARRQDALTLSTASTIYFCEDHFDLPNDMINYTEYHIMGKVSQVRMKPGCLPKKFECQEDRRKRTCSYKEPSYTLKKQRMSIIAECLNEPEQSSTPSSSVKDTSNTSSDFQIVGENVPETLCELTADKSVQALITHKFRSKAVQTKIKSTEKALSPLKPPQTSTSTSPFKSETIINSSPSVSGLSKLQEIYILKQNSLIVIFLYIYHLHLPPVARRCILCKLNPLLTVVNLLKKTKR